MRVARASYPALLHAGTALALAAVLNIWLDEAYTLHTTGKDVFYAWQQAVGFEGNAPLYFVVMALWRHINGSILFARLFSIVCTAITVSLVPSVVRRYLPKIDSAWPTLAVALNPFLIWAAVEIRLYAFVILLSTLLAIAFFDAFLADEPLRRAWTAYVALTIVSVYTWLLVLCLIAAQGFLLCVRRPRRLLSYMSAQAVTVVATLPLAISMPAQLANYRISYDHPLSFVRETVIVVEVLCSNLLGLNAYPWHHALYVVAALGAIAGLIFLARHASKSGDASLPSVCAIATLLMIVLFYAGRERMENRYGAFLFMPAFLSIYAAFTLLREPLRRRIVKSWSLLALCVAIGALFFTYSPAAKMGDWERVASYIGAADLSSVPVIVFDAENSLPLSYYDRGVHAIVPIPRPIDFAHYDEASFIVHDEREVKAALHAIDRSARVWLVTPKWCRDQVKSFGCDIVRTYMTKRYRVVATREFFATRVQRLEPADS